jgi:hypothetical protein
VLAGARGSVISVYDARDIVWVFKTDEGWTWERQEWTGKTALAASTSWKDEQGARNDALDEVSVHGGSVRIERGRW